MLKTYRIIPLVFILFLFGFTLVTVAPVLAEDSPEFVACQQIKPSGDFQLLREKKNCFRDVARALQDQISELTNEAEILRSQVKSVNQNVSNNIIPLLDSVRQGRDKLRGEVLYLCKLSGGGTIDSNKWVSRLRGNLKRMCIPSTANDYGYEVE